MGDNNKLNEQLSRLFVKWSQSEAKIRLYGPAMPQAKSIVEELFDALGEIFAEVPSFSIVKGPHGFEVIAHNTAWGVDTSCPMEASDHTVQTAHAFERFDIHSLTFFRDLTLPELERFFQGLHLSAQEVKHQSGLAGYLQDQAVQHVEVDRFRMEPQQTGKARASNAVSPATEKALEDLLQQTTAGLHTPATPVRKKAFASTWESYLSDQMDASTFASLHKNMIALAQDKPELFVRALQHMAAKQEKIETFLAHLEQKLFAVGFPQEAMTGIMQRLGRPKQVLIDEAELARLRQIERNYQPNLAERIEQSLEEIGILQRKLSDERERGDAIVRQASQGVVVLDRDGRIMEANPVALKVLGLSVAEIRGKLLKEVIQSHHMLSVVSGWEDETDNHIPKQVTIEAGSEETIDTIRESAIVIEDKNGRSIGGVSALQDVVRQSDLEKRKNDILDVLGHDLRAPLNIVKQNIDLIADFVDQPDTLPLAQQKDFLAACKRHITRMEKLINKILDVQQLETGKIVLKKVHTAANNIIEDAAHSLDSWARDKNITIEIDMCPLPDLYCDPERIYQVITNLVSNGLKFTPEGGHIQVSARTIEMQDGQGIAIAVTDSGMGINESDLERIFKKYEQVSLHQPAGVSGLGLGLSTCKTIVEMHGGTIWATSRIGEGSTFTFQLPVTEAPIQTIQPN